MLKQPPGARGKQVDHVINFQMPTGAHAMHVRGVAGFRSCFELRFVSGFKDLFIFLNIYIYIYHIYICYTFFLGGGVKKESGKNTGRNLL